MYPTLEARYAEIVDIHNLLFDQGSNNAPIYWTASRTTKARALLRRGE